MSSAPPAASPAWAFPCRVGLKAHGVTGTPSPTGDAFWVDYVAHDGTCSAATTRSTSPPVAPAPTASTAYEPEAARRSWPMPASAARTTCSPTADPYFHTVSSRSWRTRRWATATAVRSTSTGNSLPVPALRGSFTIPANTPLASRWATDTNGDWLTYDWEEFDLRGLAPNPPFFVPGTPPATPDTFFRGSRPAERHVGHRRSTAQRDPRAEFPDDGARQPTRRRRRRVLVARVQRDHRGRSLRGDGTQHRRHLAFCQRANQSPGTRRTLRSLP